MELQDIINAVDIVEYMGKFLDLKKNNNDEYIGNCCFHNEKTPSLTITPETQLFYCFGCGAGGNVLSFIQKYNNCGFQEAVNKLKQYANITDDYVDKRLNITKTIKKYKPSPIKKSAIEHNYLLANIMDSYEYSLDKLKIWIDEGITEPILNKYKVRYDPFDNRIVYPIKDTSGNIICVKGRTLDLEWKEKKLRKYTYYQKIGDVDFIFGYYEHLQDILNKKELILFEGEKSVMHCESWGIQNTGAILTSHLNPLQLPILIKLGVRIVFALDKDINIKDDENIKKLCRYTKVEYTYDKDNLLGEKMSPIDDGQDVWKKLYNERRSLN